MEGVPVLARVAAILLPICPDFPMPVTTTLPEHSRIKLHASSNSGPILLLNALIAFFSISMVRSTLSVTVGFGFIMLIVTRVDKVSPVRRTA